MSGWTIDLTTLSVPDVGEWQAQLSIAIAAAMPAAAEVLVEGALSCFERQADPWGNAWAPHADSTLLAVGRAASGPARTKSGKARRWTRRRSERASAAVFGKKILIDTGILRASIHGEVVTGPDGAGIARVVAGGPAAEYAPVHQWGSRDGHTPARPYFALEGSPEAPTVRLPEDQLAEIKGTFQDAIDQFAARMNAQRAAATPAAVST